MIATYRPKNIEIIGFDKYNYDLRFIHKREINYITDANGNLVTGDSFYREYNGFNQLVRIRNESGGILEDLVWHPIQERIFIKKIYNSSGDVATRITYLNENSVKIKNSSGTFYETYVYQDGVLVAQKDANGNKQVIHNDHLGSVSLITDSTGAVVENEFFSPYGEQITPVTNSRFSFTGKEFDSQEQDYDFMARRYRADWGKFIQPDKTIPNIYNPQTINHYSYAYNNPYRYKDPDGLEPISQAEGEVEPTIFHKALEGYLLRKFFKQLELRITLYSEYNQAKKEPEGNVYGESSVPDFETLQQWDLRKNLYPIVEDGKIVYYTYRNKIYYSLKGLEGEGFNSKILKAESEYKYNQYLQQQQNVRSEANLVASTTSQIFSPNIVGSGSSGCRSCVTVRSEIDVRKIANQLAVNVYNSLTAKINKNKAKK